jgi:Domain of unknown function (DUF4190)
LKQCTNCAGNLADFVAVCPYCGVAQAVPQAMAPQWSLQPQNSNKAIASLVCGVLFFCGPASIAAIILGHLALADIKRSANRMTGQGLAIAGLVLGYVGVGLTTLYIVFVLFIFRSTFGGRNIPVNEAAAIITMRNYQHALKAYAAKCPAQGYPATLVPLGPGRGDCEHANLVSDPRLVVPTPVRQGYMFVYNTGAPGSQPVTAFALVAHPITPGVTGLRHFYMDEDGVIRQSNSQVVGPRSPALGASAAAGSSGSSSGVGEEEDDDEPQPSGPGGKP